MGNCTLNNNYRLTVRTSVVITNGSTGFKRPRVGVKLVPNTKNARHLFHIVNGRGTVGLVLANSVVDTSTTSRVKLISRIIRSRTAVGHTVRVTRRLTKCSPVTLARVGRITGLKMSVPLRTTLTLRHGTFRVLFSARSGYSAAPVRPVVTGNTTAVLSTARTVVWPPLTTALSARAIDFEPTSFEHTGYTTTGPWP